MLISVVHIHVKSDVLVAFIEATNENALYSRLETGVARFDFLQQIDDPTRFTLVEVFRNEEAPAKHRETAHFLKWRDAVTDMMVEPRTNARHINISPDDSTWG
ncbi:MAG: antibiotic biosynthesis monooxygenase [Chloroflexota bacterium]